MKADLHIHSYYSDGAYSPADIARLSHMRGLDLISVTDHDTCLACGEMPGLLEGYGVKFVNGVEISAYSGDIKVHTLGYGFSAEKLAPFLKRLYAGSLERAEDILKKLKACGISLPLGEVEAERRSALSPVHAIHIARAAVRLGYGDNPYAFYAKYMMAGGEAYSRVLRPSPEQAIAEIKSAGGISSLAHPGRIELGRGELLRLILNLKAAGLDGVEAVYSTHTAQDAAEFAGICAKYGLLVTGGSDSHYADGRKRIGSPDFYPSAALLEKVI